MAKPRTSRGKPERLQQAYKLEQILIRHKYQIDSNINKPFIRVFSGLDFSHTH